MPTSTRRQFNALFGSWCFAMLHIELRLFPTCFEMVSLVGKSKTSQDFNPLVTLQCQEGEFNAGVNEQSRFELEKDTPILS